MLYSEYADRITTIVRSVEIGKIMPEDACERMEDILQTAAEDSDITLSDFGKLHDTVTQYRSQC
jgi:hypothetical protein